jgi:hypothetical protein
VDLIGEDNDMPSKTVPANKEGKEDLLPKIAILDDYASVALDLADWSPVRIKADVTVFDRHLSEDEAAEALQSFDVICTLRERTAFPRTLEMDDDVTVSRGRHTLKLPIQQRATAPMEYSWMVPFGGNLGDGSPEEHQCPDGTDQHRQRAQPDGSTAGSAPNHSEREHHAI